MINNWEFARELDQFKLKVIDPQEKRTEEALKIMTDLNYKWESVDQKKAGQAKLDNYRIWLDFYNKHYLLGKKLVDQHERLVDALSKWYDTWYKNISNEGKQEIEIMQIQADMMNEIFGEIYKALQPLNLDIKPPKALNL